MTLNVILQTVKALHGESLRHLYREIEARFPVLRAGSDTPTPPLQLQQLSMSHAAKKERWALDKL